jgi:hypothetical protein
MDSKISTWLRQRKDKISRAPRRLTIEEAQQQMVHAFAPLHCVFDDFDRGSIVSVGIFDPDGESVYQIKELRLKEFHSAAELVELLGEARKAIAAQGQILAEWAPPW